MYKKNIYEVKSNRRIAEDVYRMVLAGDTSYLTEPGQFVNIQLSGLYLRRPISVCDWDQETITIIYKVVGTGTAMMAAMTGGEKLDLLTGLGNGFDTDFTRLLPGKGILKREDGTYSWPDGRPVKAAVIGGGVGVPPLYALAKKLKKEGAEVVAVLGFNEEKQIFGYKDFADLGIPVCIATLDGSVGVKGFVTDALKNIDFDFYFTCGPEPMLRAVHRLGKERGVEGLLSFEARMGCGFGACMGCSCETIAGTKRICVDGPVMKSGEVIL